MKKTLALLTSLSPLTILAETAPQATARTIDGLMDWFIYLAGRALPLLMIAALVLFLFGIVKRFFWSKDTADTKEAGRYILWGIVALFVMVSVWGLVNVLKSTFNLDNKDIPTPPAIPVKSAPYAQPSI